MTNQSLASRVHGRAGWAAQTGHLVFATLHTNTAIEALARLRNMGVAAYNVVDSIISITAQRLVRKLCPRCKKSDKVAPLLQRQFGFIPEQVIYCAAGCQHCIDGYIGRIAVHEVLKMNENFYENIFVIN